ncbi:MAG TPA: hypothetical protein VHO07_06310 [Streptosporangiaceae bacterium]|jgi:hypothetical protein|nr:hypothetical protein [Streptosporangiaceae bacterium]HEX2819764.1 hypothetical protein [Streptosporangiaceae bacterium]
MTSTGPIEAHEARCQPHLLRLEMIARGEVGAVFTQGALAEVIRATEAVVAEAEAAGYDARAAAGLGAGGPGAAIFLQVRLNRLATAAGDAIAAAQAGDSAQMRRHLRRFDGLTAAIWTVQQAVYGARR